ALPRAIQIDCLRFSTASDFRGSDSLAVRRLSITKKSEAGWRPGPSPISMLTKNDFSAADWPTLRDSPYLVGFATLMAGSSGLGKIKESIALAQGVMENQTSAFAFIRDVSNSAEMEAAQGSLRKMFGGSESKPSKETLQRLALEQVRKSLFLLAGKA